jgi:nicotinamidase-related amidase
MNNEIIDLHLSPRRTAIVAIDLQKGIAGMPGGASHTKPSVIANCARLLSAAFV